MTLPPSHPGRWFAVAATLVSAPRLVLAFLAGDGVALASGVRIALLTLSSVATAAALTGGTAYLAHAIATVSTGRRALGAIWLAALLCSSALMAPLIVAGLDRSPLAGTLASPASRWTWAVCAVLAVDLVAAGAMRAEALQHRDRNRLDEEHHRALAELIEQRDSVRAQALLAPAQRSPLGVPGPAQRTAPDHPESPPQPTASGSGERLPRARPRRRSSTGLRELRCPCGREFASQQALAGHQRWCARPLPLAAAWSPAVSAGVAVETELERRA